MASGTTAWSVSGIVLQPGTNVLTVTARDAANNAGTATVTVTYDATAPIVSMTAPANGATVSGTITLTANASDNLGVVGVQFLLDGAALGAEQTTAPFSLSWTTNSVANGAHTLSARARDAAGNIAPLLLRPTPGLGRGSAARNGRHGPDRGEGERGFQGRGAGARDFTHRGWTRGPAPAPGFASD